MGQQIACGLVALSAALVPAAVVIPGAAWSDQNGDLVQLHGVGILEWEGKYYAYGQDMRDGEPYHAVACYASDDLATWTRQRDSLSFEQSPELQAAIGATRFVIERPKVLFNSRTKKFVMLFHFDTAKRDLSLVGVATSDRPDGPFTYQGKFKPHGNRSGDMGTFVDPNGGQAYLIAEDRVQANAPAKARTVIYKLNDDYTDVVPDWQQVLPSNGVAGAKYPDIEAPAIVYHPEDKLYYVFGSLLTGWDANDNVYTTTPSLEQPQWTPCRMMAKPGLKTYTSQTSFVLPVRGSKATSYVFIADRWLKNHLWDSPPVFLPIALGPDKATLDWHDAWSIDVHDGTWRPERPIATLKPTPSAGGMSFNDVRVERSGEFTLAFTYRNADPIARFGFDSVRRADVHVNGGDAHPLSFPVTTDPRNPGPRAVTRVRLDAGRPNRIDVANAAGPTPDVEAMDIYENDRAL